MIKKAFTKKEDYNLKLLIEMYGDDNWAIIANNMPSRTAKQCKERWKNSISVTPPKTDWTNEEDNLLIQMHENFGDNWDIIAKHFIHKSANAIKIRWYYLKRHPNKLPLNIDPRGFEGDKDLNDVLI